MTGIDEIVSLSETLIESAREALEASKRKDYNLMRTMIDRLEALTKTEIQMVLARVQILPQRKPLFFDVINTAEEIEKEIKECKVDLQKGDTKAAERLLKRIVDLEADVLKKEMIIRLEVILASKVAGEAALMVFIRTQIDPYVRWFGHQIDILDYRVTHVGELIKHQGEELVKSINIFSQKKEETKKEMVVTNEKIMNQYQGLVEHPTYIPHLKVKEPYEYIFSDGAYITLLAAFAGVVLLKNIPTYIRKKRDEAKIKRIYYALNKQMQNQFSMFTNLIRSKGLEIEKLNKDIVFLEKEVERMRYDHGDTAELLKQYQERLDHFQKIVLESSREIDRKAEDLGKEAGKIIGRQVA